MSIGVDVSELIRQYPVISTVVLLTVLGLARDYFQRKSYLNGLATVQEAAIALVVPLREQQDRDSRRITRCEEKLLIVENSHERLYAGCQLLVAQLEQMKAKPVWTPRDSDRPIITRGNHIDYR